MSKDKEVKGKVEKPEVKKEEQKVNKKFLKFQNQKGKK